MYAFLSLCLLWVISEIESTDRHPFSNHAQSFLAPEITRSGWKQPVSVTNVLGYMTGDDVEEAFKTSEQRLKERQELETKLAKEGRVINLQSRTTDPSLIRNSKVDPQIHSAEGAHLPFEDATDYLYKRYNLSRDTINTQLPAMDTTGVFGAQAKETCETTGATARCNANSRYRRIDGQCNNLRNPRWGSAMNCQPRLLPANYEGASGFRNSVGGGPLPRPRQLSLNVHNNYNRPTNYVNHMYMFFGQLLDHDITQTPQSTTIDNQAIQCCPPENETHPQCAPILLSSDDPFYSQFNQMCINFVRSAICPTCKLVERRLSKQVGTDPSSDKWTDNLKDVSDYTKTFTRYLSIGLATPVSAGPRQLMNQVTSTIDASFVYGNSENETRSLRTNDGTGRLRITESDFGDLLPQSADPENDQCSFPETNEICFDAGDSRANQHTVLTSLQTIFLREHNRIANALRQLNPRWNGERIFQETRRILGALMQVITYKEYLPVTLGNDRMTYYNLWIGRWSRYDPSVDPTTLLEFTTAAFRFGHSLINSIVANRPLNASNDLRLLRNEFFQPFDLYRGFIGPLVEGASNSAAQWFDRHLVPDVTNFLYRIRGNPTGLDLAAININRGRDHGLPTYVETVRYCSLGAINVQSFDDLVIYQLMRPEQANVLGNNYRFVEDIDLWTGILSEIYNEGAVVGPTGACIIGLQFRNMKYGDRFYFEHVNQRGSFTLAQLQELRRATLSQIICLNTRVQLMPRNAMLFSSASNPNIQCRNVRGINLSYWRDSRFMKLENSIED